MDQEILNNETSIIVNFLIGRKKLPIKDIFLFRALKDFLYTSPICLKIHYDGRIVRVIEIHEQINSVFS
jgi:hypothetical protein